MINYLIGDATNPIGNGNKVIAHIVNTEFAWGAGFVLAISKKWKEPKRQYKNWKDMTLGGLQIVQVESDIYVANMCAQTLEWIEGKPPINYVALEICLNKLASWCMENKASVHSPKFGAGLAGGRWEIIEKIIDRTLIAYGIETNIYKLK